MAGPWRCPSCHSLWDFLQAWGLQGWKSSLSPDCPGCARLVEHMWEYSIIPADSPVNQYFPHCSDSLTTRSLPGSFSFPLVCCWFSKDSGLVEFAHISTAHPYVLRPLLPLGVSSLCFSCSQSSFHLKFEFRDMVACVIGGRADSYCPLFLWPLTS